jgi:hypothetical protein
VIRALTFEELKLVAEKIGYEPTHTVRSVAIINSQGGPLAAVLYDHWCHNSANVHIWSSGPGALFRKEFVHAIFQYPFEDCGRGVLLGITPGDAKESLALSRALGFKEVYRIKDGWKVGVDLVIKEMRKENCRYLAKVA